MVCPVPSIVSVCTIAGRPLPTSVIVPLTLKLIVSVPVPAMQLLSLLVLLLLAFSMAPRRLHSPEVPGSAVVLTVIVLPPACSPDWVRTRQTGASTISRATSNPGRTIALEALRLQPTADDKARAKHLGGISVLSLRFQLLYRCDDLPVHAFRPVSVQRPFPRRLRRPSQTISSLPGRWRIRC